MSAASISRTLTMTFSPPRLLTQPFSICALLLGAVLLCGCASNNDPLESKGQVHYYDRNGDGKVDQEKHHYRGVADADWELRDDNYDGRYEKRILYGVGIIE